MKKIYEKPRMKSIRIVNRSWLLSGSPVITMTEREASTNEEGEYDTLCRGGVWEEEE